MFVIKCKDGRYLAEDDGDYSHVSRIDQAKKYATEKEADEDKCGSEEIVINLTLSGGSNENS